jgi:rubrerythrin
VVSSDWICNVCGYDIPTILLSRDERYTTKYVEDRLTCILESSNIVRAVILCNKCGTYMEVSLPNSSGIYQPGDYFLEDNVVWRWNSGR